MTTRSPVQALRTRLNLGAAGATLAFLLAPAAVTLTPSKAAAQDQCGSLPVLGSLLCGVGRYADGIAYEGVTGDLLVRLDAGADVLDTVLLTAAGSVGLNAEAPIYSANGSGLVATAGSVVDLAGTTVQTTADAATAVLINAGGAVGVDLDNIITVGDGSGLLAVNTDGSISINLGAGRSEGDDAPGVELVSLSGPVSLDAGVLETLGDRSRGGLIQAGGGLTDVNVSVLRTGGFEAAGLDLSIDAAACALLASGSCDTTFTVGELVTNGDFSPGAIVRAAGALDANVGVLRTEGVEAVGLDLAADPDACVVLGVGACDTTFDIADLSTGGAGAVGVLARLAGSVTGSVGVLRTEGDDAIGLDIGLDPQACVLLGAGGCDIDLTGDAVTTEGSGAIAVLINAAGDVAANFGFLGTRGDDAPGLAILLDPAVFLTLGAGACAVNAQVDEVETGGDNSGGVVVESPGPVDVDAGDISTGGNNSDGVNVSGGDEPVDIDTGGISTEGDGSDGVDVSADGSIDISTGDIATGGAGSDGVAVDGGAGPITIVTGDITTIGDDADGVDASGDGAIDITTGDITTEGDGSQGVIVVGGDGAISVDVGDVTTSGDEAEGVAVTGDGAIDVTGDEITTGGAGAEGVIIAGGDGDVVVTVDTVTTTGPGATAVVVGTTGGDQQIVVGDVTASGAGSNGIDADSANGDIAITVSRDLVADADGVNASTGGAVTIDVLETGSVTGGANGIVAVSGEGTRITNAGVITGGSGLAINVDGAGATIVNDGTLTGRVDLTDATDSFTNNGRFETTGESAFGGGDDVFSNNGVVAVSGAVALSGLETFVNTGLIDMINGVAGDSLTVPGGFIGADGSALGVDVALATAGTPADQLIIGGTATGLTRVTVNNIDGGGAVLNPDGVTIIRAAGGAAGAFALADGAESSGFIDYSLSVEDDEVRLLASPGGAVFELAKIARFGQQSWQAGADAWSYRARQIADAEAGGRGRRVSGETWGQAFGSSLSWGEGGETATGFDGEQTRDLAFDADRTGFQAGVDWLRGGSYWGLTSGVSRSEYRFQTSRTSVDVQAANLGAYAGWSANGLRAEVLAKADALELRLTNPTAPFLETFDGLSTGVQAQVAWRLGDQRIYVEPQAQLAYVHTRLDDFEALGAAITLDDVDSAEGRLGVRLGSNSGDLRPYVSAHAVQEWGGARGLFSSGGFDLPLSDEDEATYGLVTAGADASWNGLESFIQGEAAFGDVEGWGARLGVRIRW